MLARIQCDGRVASVILADAEALPVTCAVVAPGRNRNAAARRDA
jgi:hypothetical protein